LRILKCHQILQKIKLIHCDKSLHETGKHPQLANLETELNKTKIKIKLKPEDSSIILHCPQCCSVTNCSTTATAAAAATTTTTRVA